MKNIHIPLQDDLHAALMAHARETGESATSIARKAIESLVLDLERAQRQADIAAFAAEYAGTEWDLDPDLENAGLEALEQHEAGQHVGERAS